MVGVLRSDIHKLAQLSRHDLHRAFPPTSNRGAGAFCFVFGYAIFVPVRGTFGFLHRTHSHLFHTECICVSVMDPVRRSADGD